jgi:hypothetical protein
MDQISVLIESMCSIRDNDLRLIERKHRLRHSKFVRGQESSKRGQGASRRALNNFLLARQPAPKCVASSGNHFDEQPSITPSGGTTHSSAHLLQRALPRGSSGGADFLIGDGVTIA